MLMFDLETPMGLRSTSYLEVESTTPIGGNEEKPSYYIVNYKYNKGFVIIAADMRSEAILAYSTEGGFQLAGELPGGLVNWMQSTDVLIQDIREEKIEPIVVQTRGGLICNALKSVRVPPGYGGGGDEPICYPTSGPSPADCNKTYTKGPLLKTAWHQGEGFNEFVFYYSSLFPPTTKQALAGCVPVAMGQVMYYHKHPSTYKWSEMHYLNGGTEASRLMYNLGYALGTKYSADGGSSNTGKAPDVFKKNFSYSSASFGGFNSTTVKSQLDKGLPVILRGKEASATSFLGIHGDGHAWVCDGYISTTTCTTSFLQLHMNWGWGDRGDDKKEGFYQNFNGWYSLGDWRVSDSNYNKSNDMVYNIQP